MASFVDSSLAGSAGFADTINDAPGIRQRIAAARIVLEKTENAGRVLRVMADFGVDTARYAIHHHWASRLTRDAKLHDQRLGSDMRLAVFHYPLAGWVDAVTMNVLMGCVVEVQLEELSGMSYAPLAEAFRVILPIERRHGELGLNGLRQIRLSADGHRQVEEAINYWMPRVAASFGQANSPRFALLRQFGLRRQPNEALLAAAVARVRDRLAPLDLLISKESCA